MMRNTLLALGLLLSAASQLRFAGSKIGPGEACLALWILLMVASELKRLGPPLTPVFSRMLLFWVAFAVAMCLGTMAGFAIGDIHDTEWFLHDTISYGLVATLSCLMVVEPMANARLQRVAWLLVKLGIPWLALQVAVGWGVVSFENLDPWSWDRLRGFYENPNQLGLTCAVLALLSLHLTATARTWGERVAALTCMGAAIVVGRLTLSDAFVLVLVASGSLFVVLTLGTWLLSRERRLTLKSASAWILLLATPALGLSLVPLSNILSDRAEDAVSELTRGTSRDTEESAQIRFHNWGQALRRGMESGMLGLGPGPHLEIPPSILAGRRSSTNAPKNVRHPEAGLAPNFEAHNTILDLFTQGGLIAVLSLVWLTGAAASATLKAKHHALTALLGGIVIFSMFHLIVRIPLVWFAVAFCLVATSDALARSATAALPRRQGAGLMPGKAVATARRG